MCFIVVFLSHFYSLSECLDTHIIACADVPILWEQWYEATGALAYIEQILISSVGLRKALSCVCSQEGAHSLLGQAQLLNVKHFVKEIETIIVEDDSSCDTDVTKDKFFTLLESAVKAIKEKKITDGSGMNPDWPECDELEAFHELHSVIWVLLRRSVVETCLVLLEAGKRLHFFIVSKRYA